MESFDLNKVENKNCYKKCNKNDRKAYTIDDMCVETLSTIDNRPVRCVGDWAEEKIFYLVKYFGIFSQGMHIRWNGLNYIEICSGPGRCVNRDTGIELDGTPLAIGKHKNLKYISNALFFDIDNEIVTNLNDRFIDNKLEKAQAIQGDYYHPETICNVLKEKYLLTILTLYLLIRQIVVYPLI
ncbi:MAG: hypothetical protein U5P10_09575 [Spirochaetia bacterium]|nr:hypothetical protein [Spirochaetia bacterium]